MRIHNILYGADEGIGPYKVQQKTIASRKIENEGRCSHRPSFSILRDAINFLLYFVGADALIGPMQDVVYPQDAA